MLSDSIASALLNPGNTNIKPGLQRMQQVLENLGNPQHQYKVIHITGTNGKGSTAAFISTGLIHARFKTGKFMSPHILKINECISINNQEISDEDIERVYFIIDDVVQKHNLEKPSPFELLTIIMFYYMAEMKVDYLVLEAGMGGETDCTNVVDSIYSVITNVGLEHTKWLGDTLDKIATNKAGIIKNGKTIIADNGIELLNAVKNRTNNYVNVLEKYKLQIDLDNKNFQTHVHINLNNDSFSSASVNDKLQHQSFTSNHSKNTISSIQLNQNGTNPVKDTINTKEKIYKLSLYGYFQSYNFMIAYEIFRDLNIAESSIVYAAENSFIPYRFHVIERDPIVIYDITHNLLGAIALVNSIILGCNSKNNNYNKDDIVFVTAILGDKDIREMLEKFSSVTNDIVFTSICNNPRAITATELNSKASGLFKNMYVIEDCKSSLQFAKSLGKKLIIVCGSSYIFKSLDVK